MTSGGDRSPCMMLSGALRVLSACGGGSGDGTGSASTAQETGSPVETGNGSDDTGCCGVEVGCGKAKGSYQGKLICGGVSHMER